MIDIGNRGNVKITRGDSIAVPYFINANSESSPTRYILKNDDILYFAIMEPNQRFEDAIIKKVYTANSLKTEFNDVIIFLNPEDTEYLLPGKYFYTFKLRRFGAGGQEIIKTTTPEHELWILD